MSGDQAHCHRGWRCEEIEKLLAEAAETIRTAETTAEMTAAYEEKRCWGA